eukprot:gene31408-38790_t
MNAPFEPLLHALSHPHDLDHEETAEWREALLALIGTQGQNFVMTTLQFRPFAAAAALAICGIALIGCTTSGPQDHASTASSNASVDAQIDATLSKLYSTVPGAREMVDTSKGMLIFPSVVGGSFVIGAEYGRGALQINGQTQRYYSIAGGSLGPQFGAQSKAIIYLFTTQQALEKFLASQGWTVGLDATVALASIGANGHVDTATMRAPVVGFVLANAGLEAHHKPYRPLRDPSRLSAAAVLQALASDADKGLSAQDASERLRQDGPNQLRATPPQPAWRLLLSQFNDPLIYLLLGAIVVALAAWRIDGATGWPVDALVVALVVLLNGVLGFVQQARARQAVAALVSMTAVSANVLRDGRLQRVRSEDLVCGDLLVLGEGDAVGADARLTWAAALRTQESSLTGESQAVLKDPAALQADAPLGDRLCMVFKGTTVAQGTGRAVVTATAMDTEIGHIAHLLDTTQEKPTPLQTEIAHIGRVLGIGVLAIAAVVVLTIVLMTPPTDLASWIDRQSAVW